MTHQKTCHDCAHCIALYTKGVKRMRKLTNHWHCSKVKDTRKLKKGAPECPYFNLRDVTLEKQNQTDYINRTVKDINKQLKNILEVLNAE